MQKRQGRLSNESVSVEERQRYASRWSLLVEKRENGFGNASVDGMTVYKSYNAKLGMPLGKIGYVVRLIRLNSPALLRENNRRASWEDMEEAVRLAIGAQGNQSLMVIFRDDGLFVLAKKDGFSEGK